MTRASRPPFAYYGGKVGMAPHIVSLMPKHRVYIEPFFGSGAVFFAKQPAQHEIVNDLDGSVVAFFRCLRDRADELTEVCALTPYARAEFAAADLNGDLDDLERARRFWVRVNQSFNKTAGDRTGWSITTARTQSTAASTFSRLGRFGDLARRLATVVIEQCDAAGLIERLATDDTVVYADPPYPASSRSGRHVSVNTSDYRQDMGDEASHQLLAEVLHATPATVILSGYPSPLYEDLYGDWDRLDIPVRVHSSNAVTSERGQRTEVLWCNRELRRAATLFDGTEVVP
jgi:DNA adenine methylase